MREYNEQTVIDFKGKGLAHVRIRIKDDASAELLQLLDRIVQDCLRHNLIPVIAYQANQFKVDPSEANLDLAVAWWKTVAERYQGASPLVSFNLLIEATDAVAKNSPRLNDFYEKATSEIRKTNPQRIIIIAPRLRSSPVYLSELRIPTQHNGFVMAEWHFYAAGPSKTSADKLWTTGTEAEKQLIRDKINVALAWQRSTGLPTWVGAWMPGNYNDENYYSIPEQVIFANFMTCELVKAAIPFAVNSDTKFYDRTTNTWIQEMLPVLETILQPGECG